MDAAPDSAEPGAVVVPPTRISARSGRVVRWCVSLAVAVSLALPGALLTGSALAAERPVVALVVVAMLWDAALILVIGWLVAVLPRDWTAQGVVVDAHGLTFEARPLWWFRGRRAVVPWPAVLDVTRGTRTAGRGLGAGPAALLDRLTSLGHERTLELRVRELPAPADLPAWAQLRPPDTMVLSVADDARVHLHSAVRAVAGERRPPAAHDAAAAQWVSLRGVGIVPRRLGAVGPTLFLIGLGAAAALGYGVVDGLMRGFGADDVPLAVLVPCGLPVPVWLGYRLPRLITRQGVAADERGITLVQEPRWWFSGATVQLPWADVRSIDEDVVVTGDAKNRRTHLVVEIRLTRSAPDRLPSWVETKRRREVSTALVLFPGRRRHARVLAALRATRPN